MGKKPPEPSNIKIIALNKKARFDFHIVEKFEAGIVLTGAEIKSIRDGGISLQESYVGARGGELFLLGAHIKPYSCNADLKYDPVRPRKLLLHKREIEKVTGRVATKGFTVVALSIYLKQGRAKLEIALATGKAAPDKRDTIKARESQREMARAIKKR